jgi:hypothetical protein
MRSWLISGPPGIGKATLAYRMARFVLAHPACNMPAVQRATSLAVDGAHPVARRIAAQAHPDLLVIERTINEKTGKLHQEIQVDDVRRSIGFFGSTAAEGGWRVAIVDVVDELNKYGANALLKILEEPPRQALLLLVSHSAARVLPTIRSRCRVLGLRPLAAGDVARAAAAAIGREPGEPSVISAAAASEGSVRRAVELLDADALDLRKRIMALLDALPGVDRVCMQSATDLWHRSQYAPRRVRGRGERVARRAARVRAAGSRASQSDCRNLGTIQPGQHAMSIPSISTASHWCSTCLMACRGIARLIPMLDGDKPRYYVTTAIAYPIGPPHIGHAIRSDGHRAIARFMRLEGYDVLFPPARTSTA